MDFDLDLKYSVSTSNSHDYFGEKMQEIRQKMALNRLRRKEKKRNSAFCVEKETRMRCTRESHSLYTRHTKKFCPALSGARSSVLCLLSPFFL